jgi:hypothetical protein
LLSLPSEKWFEYSQGDLHNPELVFPPDGISMPYDEAVATYVPQEIKDRLQDEEQFAVNSARCSAALDDLAQTLLSVKPDVTVIVSDDQDEWFYDDNMPAFAIFWGDRAEVIPRPLGTGAPGRSSEMLQMINDGYGDKYVDVPVAGALGRYLIEYLMDHDFDIAQMNYVNEQYGGRVGRRYPTKDGELDVVRTSEPRLQGLPHGFSFIVRRLFGNKPGTILPVIQNTCYPPNQVTPRRCYSLGVAISQAIAAWDEDITVAVIASGGLSHFVVDEELDRTLLKALQDKDGEAMRNLPRHRLYSATSESMNWVTLGGVMESSPLAMSLVDYVPVYRTVAGTGGGWAFAKWQ